MATRILILVLRDFISAFHHSDYRCCQITIAITNSMIDDHELVQASAAVAEVKYIQTGIQLHLHCIRNKLNTGIDWEEWSTIFDEEVQLLKVEGNGDKLICLRRYGGKEIRRLVKHLPMPDAEENDTDFQQAVLN